MSGFGTDVVALACIVGSAATSGGLTLAFLDRSGPAPADCAVEAVGNFAVSPRVVVTRGDRGHTVVLSTPGVRIHTHQDCAVVMKEQAMIHFQEMRREMEEARLRVEVNRRDVERVRAEAMAGVREAMEVARAVRLQGREAQALEEAVRIRVEEAQAEVREALERARAVEADVATARPDVKVVIRKGGEGSGGQTR